MGRDGVLDQPKGLRNLRHDQIRIAYSIKGHKEHAVREGRKRRAADLDRQARLAGAARPGQRHQPRVAMSRSTSLSSRARPTKRVSGVGRLLRAAADSVRGGGNSALSPGATTWYSRSCSGMSRRA